VDAWTAFTRASQLAGRGNHQRAIDELTRAIQLDPLFADAYYDRGLAFARLGDHQRALDDFTRALVLKPAADAYVNRAAVYQALADFAAAIADYDRAIALEPSANLLHSRGWARAQSGNLQSAIDDYTAALARAPHTARTLVRRGQAHLGLGNEAEGLADLRHAIALNAASAELLNAGEVRLLGIPHNFSTRSAGASIEAGRQRAAHGDLTGALAQFEAALALTPNDPNIVRLRGALHAQRGELHRAAEDEQRAIGLYRDRGMTRSQCGDHQGALADFDAVVTLRPAEAGAYYDRAVARARAGQRTGAATDRRYAEQLVAQQYAASPPDTGPLGWLRARINQLFGMFRGG
jgi:tetratricopeptide (TPR) repeat protein